jgi:uncharacterized protein with PQ loop repeat
MNMEWPNLVGMAGAVIAGGAYLPQIVHLIKEHCSAGISRSAYALWLFSSILVTINAVYIHSYVFMALGAVQILSTAIIYTFSIKYKDQACPFHAVSDPAV